MSAPRDDDERSKSMTHESSWPLAQRNRLSRFLDMQANDHSTTWVGYWCSDAWGRSANSGSTDMVAAPWVTQTVKGPLQSCSANALHATREPHRWKGCRVWVVALIGKRHDEGEKSAALQREIIGEILPQDVIDPKIALRMGLPMRSADLRSADLRSANLYGADLGGADLCGANLRSANLGGANLCGADLCGANLGGADLCSANLGGANLRSADLGGANLRSADLCGANLYGANLCGADLCRTDRPAWLPKQWIVTATGHLARGEP